MFLQVAMVLITNSIYCFRSTNGFMLNRMYLTGGGGGGGGESPPFQIGTGILITTNVQLRG